MIVSGPLTLAGLEVLASLPVTDLFEGRIVLVTGGFFYYYASGVWEALSPASAGVLPPQNPTDANKFLITDGANTQWTGDPTGHVGEFLTWDGLLHQWAHPLPNPQLINGILSSDGTSAFWTADPALATPGQFLQWDGLLHVWADPPTGIPDMTLMQNWLLTNDGTDPIWTADPSAALPGQFLQWDGSAHIWATPPGSLPVINPPDTGLFLSNDGTSPIWDAVQRSDLVPILPEANHVLINDALGAMSSEQFLAQSRGGFGQDVSLLPSGVVSYNATTDLFSTGPISLGRYESTAIITGGALSINADTSKFNIAAGTGYIVDYTVDPYNPTITPVTWGASSAVVVTNLATSDQTYILMTAAGTIIQQTIFPTPAQMRDNIYIGELIHPSNVAIIFAYSSGLHNESLGNQFYDFMSAVGPFNVVGNSISANGATMTIAKSAGIMFAPFFNWNTTPKNPHEVVSASAAPVTFAYRTRNVGTTPTTTLVDPLNYDLGGVVTPVGATASTAQVQRVYLLPSGDVRIQYGQQLYSSLAVALDNMGSEVFVTAPVIRGFGILIGYIVIQRNCTTAVNDTTKCRIFSAARFEVGPAAGSLASTTLQQAYNNSLTPMLVLGTTPLPGAFDIRDNSVPLVGSLFDVANFAGSTKYLDVTAAGVSSVNDYRVFQGGLKDMMVGQSLFDLYPTGAKTFAGITITNPTFTVGAGTGQVVDHVLGQYFPVTWGAFTGQVPVTANGVTYVYVTRAGAISLSGTPPTANTRRDMIFLARVGVIGGTIVGAATATVSSTAALQQLVDLAESISAFRVSGVAMSANGANTKIDRSAGFIYQSGVNFVTDPNNPSIRTISAQVATTLLYATRDTIEGVFTDVRPGFYDPNATPGGVPEVIPGANSRTTIQRIYQFTGSTLTTAIQYGAEFYNNIPEAIAAIGSETYTINPNFAANAILVGLLIMVKNCSNLQDPAQARFLPVSRFGESAVGGSGQSVSTLQNAYNNSSGAEILTDLTRGALTVQRGSLADTDNVYEGKNGAGVNTFSVTGEGDVTGLSFIGTQQVTPSNPPALQNKIYPKADNRWYTKDSTGVESALGGGLNPVAIAAGPAVAVKGTHYLTDTTAGPFTITLPAGSTGATLRFTDAAETWGLNNLTLTPAVGQKIDMLAINETLVCDVVRGWVQLDWNGTYWVFGSLASTSIGEASGTAAGIVSIGTQSFAGNKTFLGSITPTGGIVGNTSGVAAAAGFAGEMFGSIRSGSGGFTYSDQSALKAGGSATQVLSRTLNKGIYLLSFSSTIGAGSSIPTVFFADIQVGGVSINQVNQWSAMVDNDEATRETLSGVIPIVISADNTVVRLLSTEIGQTATPGLQVNEWWIVRLAS